MIDRVSARLDDIAGAVDRWASAGTIDEAKAGAEAARNMITGPATLGAGDLDGDGRTIGLEPTGLLPSADGTAGLLNELACDPVERDALGGSWDDADERWSILARAIDAWTEANNPFPSLPSHPQRVVGWATLTLRTTSLEDAHSFAGHARIHVGITRSAVDDCAGIHTP